jgi:hypothetical protein
MRTIQGILDGSPLPEIVPLPREDWADGSSLSITIVEGPTLNLWSIATAMEGKTKGELNLQLQPRGPAGSGDERQTRQRRDNPIRPSFR